jgi:hypothetical protein
MGSENNVFSGSLRIALDASETVAASNNAASAQNQTIRHKDFGIDRQLNSRSVTPLELAVYNLVDVDTGGVELDLTNLTTYNNGEADATGLKLYGIMVESRSTGSAYLTTAASNNYPINVGSSTLSAYTTTNASITRTVNGSVSPPVNTQWQLVIPTDAVAGFIRLSEAGDTDFASSVLTYDPSVRQVQQAMETAVHSSGGSPDIAAAAARFTVTESPAGTFNITAAGTYANQSRVAPTITLQGLLKIASTTIVGGMPIYGKQPTVIMLGTNGDAVSSTKKKLRFVANEGTVSLAITLWFI